MERFSLLVVLSGSLVISGLGCRGASPDYKKTTELKKAPPAAEHHDHGAKGPHGGSLVELGEEEFHGEVVLDHDSHTLRVFILGKDAKTDSPTEAKEVTVTPNGKDALTLKAVPQEKDGEGKSSRFELVDEDAVHKLLDDGAIHGMLRVTIGDKPFSGEIDYHLDDVHHEHKDKPADAPKAEDKPEVKKDATTTDKDVPGNE